MQGSVTKAHGDLCGNLQTLAPGPAEAVTSNSQGYVAELATSQERLRNVTEELEVANQELQSSNEEYLSINEELQSSNEELETSKEELQSLNEELQTINAELNSRNESLVRVNSDLDNLFNSTSIATLFLDRDLRIRRFTPGVADIFRIRAGDEGREIADIASHLSGVPLIENIRNVLLNLKNVELEVQSADKGSTYQLKIRPYRDLANVVDGTVLTFVDVSLQKKHQQHTGLLLAELDHRVKNILSIVMAIISQTLKNTPDPEEFAAEIGGRITAIAKAHNLLTQSDKGEVQLREIMATELAAYDRKDGNIVLNGDGLVLPPKLALSLAMAVHELASNAAKYGALSVPEGSLTVEWKMTGRHDDASFTLNWIEAGGPAVEEPTRRGFGTTLIEKVLTIEYGAQVTRAFLPSGLRCTIAVPLAMPMARENLQ